MPISAGIEISHRNINPYRLRRETVAEIDRKQEEGTQIAGNDSSDAKPDTGIAYPNVESVLSHRIEGVYPKDASTSAILIRIPSTWNGSSSAVPLRSPFALSLSRSLLRCFVSVVRPRDSLSPFLFRGRFVHSFVEFPRIERQGVIVPRILLCVPQRTPVQRNDLSGGG